MLWRVGQREEKAVAIPYNPPMAWPPDLTVAGVIERDGKFLLVEERISDILVFNQPAGHVEPGESFLEAVIRETKEESAWSFQPQALVGVYLWGDPRGPTFLRLAFCGSCCDHDPTQALDDGIVRTVWLTREQVLAKKEHLRSPMVQRCIDDYLAGDRFSLDALKHLGDVPTRVALG